MISLEEVRKKRLQSMAKIEAFLQSTDSEKPNLIGDFLQQIIRESSDVKFGFISSFIRKRPEMSEVAVLEFAKILPLSFVVEAIFTIISNRESCNEVKMACGKALSAIVTKTENGLCVVVEFMSVPYTPGDSKLLEQICKIILRAPKSFHQSTDEYLKFVIKKISRRLLTSFCARDSYFYLTTRILEEGPHSLKIFILQSCFNPLLCHSKSLFQQSFESIKCDSLGNKIVVDQDDFDLSLNLILEYLKSSISPLAAKVLLTQLGGSLLHIFIAACQRKSGIKSKLEPIWGLLFKSSSRLELLWFFENINVFLGNQNENVKLTSSPLGGLMVVENDFLLLQAEDDQELLTETRIFESLLNLIMGNEEAQCIILTRRLAATSSALEYEPLSQMFEKYQMSFLKFPSILLSFLCDLLEKRDFMDDGFISVILTLVTTIVKDSDSNLDVSVMKKFIAIIENQPFDDKHRVSELLEKLKNSCLIKIERMTNLKTSETSDQISSHQDRLLVALKEVNGSFDVVTRSHGVFVIREILCHKSSLVDETVKKIEDSLLACLYDSDSYLYLSAVKSLALLVDQYPDKLLENLFAIYCGERVEYAAGLDHSVGTCTPLEFRLRLGECLLQIVQRLGLAFDTLAPKILQFIYKVIRDDCDKDMKASALSILSVVAEVSPLSLRFDLFNIVKYCHDCILMEGNVFMRRAAMCVVRYLVDGLNDLIGLEGSITKEMDLIADCLDKISGNALENDQVLKFHSDAALSSLMNNKK